MLIHTDAAFPFTVTVSQLRHLFQEVAEVPIGRLADRSCLDEVGQLLETEELVRISDVSVAQSMAGNQTALGKLIVGDDAVDGEVRGHVVDVVGLHPTGGAVLEDEVVALMLQQPDHLHTGHGGAELRIPVEVEVSVTGGDTRRGDLLVPDLGDVPHDLREEGLREEESDAVGVQAEGLDLSVRRSVVARNARISRLVSHRCLHAHSIPQSRLPARARCRSRRGSSGAPPSPPASCLSPSQTRSAPRP